MTAAGAPGAVGLGLLRLAGLDLALPLSSLREVVPAPEAVSGVPARAEGLLGVMALRGAPVPLVDLAAVLDRPHERRAGQVVVVVLHGERVVGLLVDEVRGLATVPPDDLVPVAATREREGSGAPLLSASFVEPGGAVVSVLDPAAVLALPGVPVARDVRTAPPAGRAPSTAGTRSLTLVRCGAYTLALDVAHVHSTVPSPAPRPSPVDGPTCLGVTPVAGSAVAVADLLALVGLGSQASAVLDCGLVLDLPDGQVVLGVGAMVGLHEVPAEAVVPLPAVASPAPDLLREVADVAGVGACLLVDGARLRALDEVRALSRVTTSLQDDDPRGTAGTAAAAGGGGGGPARGPAHLAYRAGTRLATPLEQVAEVLAHPADLVPTSGAPGVLGVVVHRGVAVPVLSLAGLLGRSAEGVTASARLLLLDVDGEPVAYAVDALDAILPLAWTDPDDRPPAGRDDPLRGSPLVQLYGADGLVPALDLVALTRSQRGAAGAGGALPGPRAPQEHGRLAAWTSG